MDELLHHLNTEHPGRVASQPLENPLVRGLRENARSVDSVRTVPLQGVHSLTEIIHLLLVPCWDCNETTVARKIKRLEEGFPRDRVPITASTKKAETACMETWKMVLLPCSRFLIPRLQSIETFGLEASPSIEFAQPSMSTNSLDIKSTL